MKVRRLLNKLQRGEKGFTLIELLVVIAILGILAAVIILNVIGMMGSGRVEAANTEAHNVQIAILAAMVDQDKYSITAGWVGDDVTEDIAVGTTTVKAFLTGSLQGEYSVNTAGQITGGGPGFAGSKWTGMTYTTAGGWIIP